ncbi:F-box/FBD/LRR-repeat protein At5g56420-like [Tasmannia lanceolata]|uniref:F-box/FBD/LRR-repeat protein At5g56420-like n=1 Tax=Tasmannia lanceolata TaxID=3420 RepID=UPI0040647C34
MEKSEQNTSISDLPEHLLLLILSFLPIKDAVSTSFLSRRWRGLWTFIQSLDFDHTLILPQTSYSSSSENLRLFSEFVDRTLILHEASKIEKFRLSFDYDENRYASHADSWIRFAIRNNVQELDLDFRGDRRSGKSPNEVFYDFSLSALSRGQVRVLRLCEIDLYLPTEFCFRSLTDLSLIEIELTDEIVSGLVNGCPQLESLVLDYCYGMQHLKICSPSLKRLSLLHYIDENSSVEICAPKLVSFNCIHYSADDYILKDVSSLVDADILFIHFDEYFPRWRKIIEFLGHVRSLTVQNWWMKLMEQKTDFLEKIRLDNLKHLDFLTGSTKIELLGLAILIRIAPNLETMVLQMVFETDDNKAYLNKFIDKLLSGSLLHLKKVKIVFFAATENELQLVKFLLKHAVALEKMILVPGEMEEASIERLKIMQSFHRSSPCVEILFS